MRVTSLQPFIYILVVSGLKEKYGFGNTEITQEPGSWRANTGSERTEEGMHGGGSSMCQTSRQDGAWIIQGLSGEKVKASGTQ